MRSLYFLTFTVAIFVAFINQSYVTKILDNSLADEAVNLQDLKRSDKFVVISADSDEWLLTEEALSRVHFQLLTANPAAIAYTFSLPREFRMKLENSNDRVVFPFSAKSLQIVNSNTQTLFIYPPKAAVAAEIFNEDGVIREQRLFYNTEEGIRSSIVLAALAAGGFINQTADFSNGNVNIGQINLPVDETFGISLVYSGGARSYPYLPVSKVLSGEIPDSTLRGKILFVGPTSATNSRQWLTGASIGNTPVPETELWAQTADAILSGRFLTSPSVWFSSLLVFLSVGLGGLLFRFLSPLKGALAVAILLPAFAALNIVLLLWIQLKTPFTAVAVGLILSFTVLTVAKTVNTRKMLKDLIFRIKFRARGASVLTVRENENKAGEIDWEKIGVAVSTYLAGALPLFITLEEKSGKSNLAYVDPHIADDFDDSNFQDSSPVVMALRQTGEPQRTRQLLKSKKEVLLLPLEFGKKLIGVFGLVAKNSTEDFQLTLATRLAAEISALMVGAKSSVSRKINKSDQSPFTEINTLERTVELLTSEELFLRTVLEHGADAIGVAHPLGQALFYNPRFIQVLSDCKADFSEGNLLASVARMFEARADEFAEAISKATVKRAESFLEIDSESGSSYKMTIRPLYSGDTPDKTDVQVMAPGYMETVNANGGAGALAHLRGLVFTLADTTEYKSLDETKSHLVANIQGVSQNLLTPVVAYAEILSQSNTNTEDEQQMLDVIVDRAEKLSSVFRQFTQIADSRLDGGKNERAPLNLITVIEEKIAVVRPQAEERSVRIKFDGPAVINPVFANRDEIVEAIGNLLNFVIHSVPPDSQVKLNLTERDFDVQFSIDAVGLGLPPRVMEHLVDDGAGVSGENLKMAKKTFENHGGECRFISSLKDGFRIEVSLQKDWYFQNYTSLNKA